MGDKEINMFRTFNANVYHEDGNLVTVTFNEFENFNNLFLLQNFLHFDLILGNIIPIYPIIYRLSMNIANIKEVTISSLCKFNPFQNGGLVSYAYITLNDGEQLEYVFRPSHSDSNDFDSVPDAISVNSVVDHALPRDEIHERHKYLQEALKRPEIAWLVDGLKEVLFEKIKGHDWYKNYSVVLYQDNIENAHEHNKFAYSKYLLEQALQFPKYQNYLVTYQLKSYGVDKSVTDVTYLVQTSLNCAAMHGGLAHIFCIANPNLNIQLYLGDSEKGTDDQYLNELLQLEMKVVSRELVDELSEMDKAKEQLIKKHVIYRHSVLDPELEVKPYRR